MPERWPGVLSLSTITVVSVSGDCPPTCWTWWAALLLLYLPSAALSGLPGRWAAKLLADVGPSLASTLSLLVWLMNLYAVACDLFIRSDR